jgi:predicted permease
MGIPLVAGRDFTARDDSAAPPVMIVNRRFADEMFPGENPIGKRVRSWRDENVLREIVGVVGDVRYMGAADAPRPLVYVPHRQDTWRGMMLSVRTAGDPTHVVGAIRRELRALDPDVALADVATMERAMAASVARPRFNAALLAGFAALALALASIGVYGLLAYSVARRIPELGLRIALGAGRGTVKWMVLKQSLILVGLGLAFGIPAALGSNRLVESMLFGVSPTSPFALAAAATVMLSVSLLASFVPAHRASRVDPIVALRAE